MSLELGPCQVLFGTEDAEVDLGKTEGGVVVSFATDVVDLMSDQYGTTPENQIITGQKASIKVPLAEPTLANLAFALNQDLKNLDGTYGIKGANIVGTDLKATKGQSLLIKKYVSGSPSSDTEDWLRFPLAVPTGVFDYPYSKTDQRIVEVNFTAFPDTNGNLYFFGDEDAALGGS